MKLFLCVSLFWANFNPYQTSVKMCCMRLIKKKNTCSHPRYCSHDQMSAISNAAACVKSYALTMILREAFNTSSSAQTGWNNIFNSENILKYHRTNNVLSINTAPTTDSLQSLSWCVFIPSIHHLLSSHHYHIPSLMATVRKYTALDHVHKMRNWKSCKW